MCWLVLRCLLLVKNCLSSDSKKMKFHLTTLLCVYLCLQFVDGAIKRCYKCRSRGELGDCKDPFDETDKTKNGVEEIPCASGWCGKVVERDQTSKIEEYGIATQRMCFQRAPQDGNERCAKTLLGHRYVFMCFCQGDLCNSGTLATPSFVTLAISIAAIMWGFL